MSSFLTRTIALNAADDVDRTEGLTGVNEQDIQLTDAEYNGWPANDAESPREHADTSDL